MARKKGGNYHSRLAGRRHADTESLVHHRREDQPKPLHTEATLLSAMETAGKEIEDDALRQAMKDCGIGTPATRASIIETLFKRGYMERCKKLLVPTEKGLASIPS
ncbi:DNA topoisomerase [Bacteroides faecalis]|nr:DNA topoisomerase [Bacteroides faecalis]